MTAERTLFETTHHANGHSHHLRVVEVAFPDAREVYVEMSEPDKCGCARRIALSELAHLLLNITEGELWAIPNRDRDDAGHAHPGSV